MDVGKSSTKLFISRVLGAVSLFIGTVIFSRDLGAGLLGSYFLFEVLLGFSSIVTDFGISESAEKRISEGSARDEYFSTAISIKILILPLIGAIILYFGGAINEYVGTEVAVFLAISAVLQDLSKYFQRVLRGELRVGETAFLQFNRHFMWLVVGKILIIYGFGVMGLIFGLLSGLATNVILGWYRCSLQIRRPTIQKAKSLLNFSKYSTISMVGGYFYSWIDVAIIGIFLNSSYVSAYEVAWRITEFTILFSTSIGAAVFPKASAWADNGELDKIEQMIPEVVTRSIIFVIPALFGVSVLHHEILDLIFGSEYVIAGLSLIVLMAYKPFQAIQTVVARLLLAVDRPGLAALATTTSIIVNVLLNVILVWQFGIIGAAIGTFGASLLSDGLHYYFVSDFVDITLEYGKIGIMLTISTLMAVVIYLVKQIIVVDSLIELTFCILLGGGVYLALAYNLSSLRTPLKTIVNDLY